MSLTPKLDKIYKGKSESPEQANEQVTESITHYETAGNARNLCFVLEDGKRVFLNYAYLTSGEYDPEKSEIKLTYSTHIVTLQGFGLDKMLEKIMVQMPRIVSVTDPRYAERETTDGTGFAITAIKIEEI